MQTKPPAARTPRRAPRQARSTLTVEAIFEAAIQVLLSVGPTRLTTTRVAERAGVSVGTLYQYFPNKQALLLAVLQRHLAMLAESLEAACREQHGAPVDAMAEALVKGYLQAKMKQNNVSRALYLIAIELDAGGLVDAATRRGEHAIAAMLATADARQFPDPDVVGQTLLAAVYGTVRAFYERGVAPEVGGDIERQLTILCRSYLAAASSLAKVAA